MKKRRRLMAAICATIMMAQLVPSVSAQGMKPAESSNIYEGDYTVWSKPVRSYLYSNEQGGLTRVEYVQDQVIVEDYDNNFQLTSSRTIAAELPIRGGFFAGESYNFLIFGQENLGQSDQTEVIRVVKYTKDWNRMDEASLYGANTRVPFDAGSLRCDEYGDYLYIRTSHEMYTSSDGLNHQSNLTMSVRQSDMEVADAFYKVMNSDYGYVSHSFNQFLIVDENGRIVTLDHGDAYPRCVVFMRYYADAGTGKFTSSSYNGKLCSVRDMLTFAGGIGDNKIGGSVGGLVETHDSYIMAYSYDGVGGDGDRYPYYHWMDIVTGKSWSAKVFNTPGCTMPMLASTGLDGGYMLWNEKTDYTKSDTLHYLKYSTDGKPGEVKSAQKAPLSDCNPIAYKNGVVWYVTDQSAPTFYTLDNTGVKAYPAKAGGNVKPEKPIEPEKPENPNQSNALYDPRKAPSLLDAVRMSNRLQSRIGYFYDSVNDADGKLWDLHGEYVENRNPDFNARKPEIMMKNIKQVADTWIGGNTILGLTNDGRLWAWGKVGTLGLIDDFDGHSYRPMKVMDGVKSISAYTSGVMVLKDDHSL